MWRKRVVLTCGCTVNADAIIDHDVEGCRDSVVSVEPYVLTKRADAPPKGKNSKDKSVMIRVSVEELKRWNVAATRDDRAMSAWIRHVCSQAVRR